MGQEIANRFRHMKANEADIERRQGSDQESHAPAVDGDEEIGDAGSGNPAETPKTFQEDDEPAADPRRSIFRDQSRRNGQFPTEAKAYEEAKDEERLIIPG